VSKIRVPLFGPYTNRISSVNSLDTTSGYVGIGIVGLMVVGATSASSTKDAKYVNCFGMTVPDALTGKTKLYTVKRPGWATSVTPASGNIGTAIFVWTGSSSGTDVISAFGSTNSTIYNGTTSLGAITGKARSINETVVGTTATLLVASGDNTGWYYDTGVGTMTKIADADFPGNAGKTTVGGFAVIDGFNCIMDSTGALWASDLNSVTAWTSTSFDTANSYADKGIGCVRHRNFVMAFGTESIEFYQNAGLSPFPLAKASAMTVKVGAISADAIAQIADTTFWAGSTPQGGISVFQYDGGLSRISTPEIDTNLILAGASNISLTTLRIYGRSMVLVKAGASTYVYVIEEKTWHEWSSTTPLWTKCVGVSLGGTMVNYAVSNISTSGKVYVMNPSLLVFTDDGTTYTARVQLPKMDMGNMHRKFYRMVQVVGDVETTSSTLTISYSDDDYQSYTVAGTVDLSNDERYLFRLGSSNRRSWVLSHSANTPMRLEALEVDVKVGRH